MIIIELKSLIYKGLLRRFLKNGGDGGIRTHAPIAGQNDFESFSL